MKTILLVTALLISSSAWAEPQAAVRDTMTRLLKIVAGTNEQEKISKMCSLARTDLDLNAISDDLLGRFFATLPRDQQGVRAFRALVPSIIMDQFYGLLADKGNASFSVNGTVPKGTSRIGVRITVAKANFVVVVQKANDKIVDVEYMGFSMVQTKANDYQGQLRREYSKNTETSLPVTALVRTLKSQGLDQCK